MFSAVIIYYENLKYNHQAIGYFSWGSVFNSQLEIDELINNNINCNQISYLNKEMFDVNLWLKYTNKISSYN
jgi:hypothetical protein